LIAWISATGSGAALMVTDNGRSGFIAMGERAQSWLAALGLVNHGVEGVTNLLAIGPDRFKTMIGVAQRGLSTSMTEDGTDLGKRQSAHDRPGGKGVA